MKKRGDIKSPLFIALLMDQDLVRTLVDEAIAENESLFLIELNFLPSNKIKIIVDGDDGISLKECVRISRHVEHNLDRDQEDFELQVSSSGLDQPFLVHQQYLKNVGRNVTVTTFSEEIFSGELIKADLKEISIKEIKTEKNKLTKKKQQVETIHQISMSEVRETKLIISF